MVEIISSLVPSRLYRYRSLDSVDREIKTIEDADLFCASYSKINDPMEGFFEPSCMVKKNSIKLRHLNKSVDEQIGRVGICSFSEVRDHELMWAHYADQFGGICIEYDFGLLRKKLPDSACFVRMTYNEKVIVIGNTKRPPDETARRVLSQKNHRWLYEREWRMFGPQGLISYNDLACVKSVYIGFRAPSDARKKIEARIAKLGIKIKSMKIYKYSIIF